MLKARSRVLWAFTAMQLFPAAAFAQAVRTYVSGTGDDANLCSRTAPCKTFAGAILKTAAGGEINVLDPGGYGTLTITKAITIRAKGVDGGVLASGTNGININAAAADRVVLDGLDIEGSGSGVSGVAVMSASDVLIQNCTIQDFVSAGVTISPSAKSARVIIDKSTIFNNSIGVAVQPTGTPANLAHAKIFDSRILSNPTAGVQVTGAGNDVLIAGTKILGSNKAVSLLSGASATSYGDNIITNGDAPVKLPLN